MIDNLLLLITSKWLEVEWLQLSNDSASKKKVLNTHTWPLEMGVLLAKVKVLKVQTYICNILRKQI